MNKSVLLAATSILALYTASALAAGPPLASFSGKANPFHVPKGAKLLYNQNSNDEGNFINSQNFTTSPTYTDQAADDFVIPKRAT